MIARRIGRIERRSGGKMNQAIAGRDAQKADVHAGVKARHIDRRIDSQLRLLPVVGQKERLRRQIDAERKRSRDAGLQIQAVCIKLQVQEVVEPQVDIQSFGNLRVQVDVVR